MSELACYTCLVLGMAGEERAKLRESDEALAERLRAAGDQSAFAELVTRYRVRIIVLARRMLAARNAEEAEDVAQETFLAAYEKRSSFQRGQPFRPWLYRIAVNRCLDRIRAQSRRPAVLTLTGAPEPAHSQSDPLNLILAVESERQLELAVEALPPKLRAVFLLRHLDDLTYDEISAATGVPLNTVKTHLFRARAHLRVALSEYLDR